MATVSEFQYNSETSLTMTDNGFVQVRKNRGERNHKPVEIGNLNQLRKWLDESEAKLVQFEQSKVAATQKTEVVTTQEVTATEPAAA